MIKVRRQFVHIWILFFPLALAQRAYIGLNFPTEDLKFYVSGGLTQLSRVGIEKSILFYPVTLFEHEEIRILFLSTVLAILFVACIWKLTRLSGQTTDGWLVLLLTVSIYHAQIDMHLMRQQISIYLFLIALLQNNIYSKILLFSLSALYHELATLLLLSYLLAKLFRNNNAYIKVRHVLVISIALHLISFSVHNFSGIIFSIVVNILFYICKIDSQRYRYGYFIFVFSIVISLLFLAGYIFPVNLERLIGVHVSVTLLLIIAYGDFQKISRNFKKFLVSGFLLMYSTLWVLSVA